MREYDLREYIKVVYEMEASLYQQKNLITEIEYKIAGLAHSKSYKKPILNSSYEGDLIFLIIMIVITLAGIILFLLEGIFYKVFGAIVVIVGINTIINCVPDVKKGSEAKKLYNYELAKYNKEIIEDAHRVEIEKKKKQALSTTLYHLKEKYEESSLLINKIYSVDIIYHKYRGFIPISTIYDYLCSGVCTKLDGHEGAYNKYDIESRLDKIITQLDVVISKLDQIKQSQYMLYKGIIEANDTNKQFISSLDQMQKKLSTIENNTFVEAYEAKFIRKELEYRNYMDRKFGYWD